MPTRSETVQMLFSAPAAMGAWLLWGWWFSGLDLILRTMPNHFQICRRTASRPAPARATMLAALLTATSLANGAAIQDGFQADT